MPNAKQELIDQCKKLAAFDLDQSKGDSQFDFAVTELRYKIKAYEEARYKQLCGDDEPFTDDAKCCGGSCCG